MSAKVTTAAASNRETVAQVMSIRFMSSLQGVTDVYWRREYSAAESIADCRFPIADWRGWDRVGINLIGIRQLAIIV